MTDNQFLAFLCIFAVFSRMPRLVERWKAPLLRGEGWFFSVEAPPGFLAGPGASILRRYRMRLLLPWVIELPIFAAFLLTGHARYAMSWIAVVTLFTRLNYYLDRVAAEKQARRFEVASASEPVSTFSLSLQPRTLREYTNPWIEAAIVAVVGGSLAWLGYRYATTLDWQALRLPLAANIFYLYLQGGLLLAKRGIIRARYAAPAVNADQHLAWRDSLRRLSTAICDYLRLLIALGAIAEDIMLSQKAGQGGSAQTAMTALIFGAGAIATGFEWKRRRQHLEVSRRTKPAKLLVMPDVPDALRLICFQPALPMLLLNGPNGYALNLASTAVRVAGVYLAGYAVLWACLVRLTA